MDQNTSLTILIPVLNERKILQESLGKTYDIIKSFSNIKVVIVDGGSVDGSVELLHEFTDRKELWSLSLLNLPNPSIAQGVCAGLKLVKDKEFVLIKPVDCFLSKEQLVDLNIALLDPELCWGGFYKRYNTSGKFMSFYAWIQNKVRTQILRNYVWTNGIFGRKELLEKSLVSCGFMEDVLLSDNLKKKARPLCLQKPLLVSARRYNKSLFKRLRINLKVMLLFRLKLCSVEKLKEIYSK